MCIRYRSRTSKTLVSEPISNMRNTETEDTNTAALVLRNPTVVKKYESLPLYLHVLCVSFLKQTRSVGSP